MKKIICLLFSLIFLFSACTQNELYYLETGQRETQKSIINEKGELIADEISEPIYDSRGNLFTYTPSEDTQHTVHQRSGLASGRVFVSGKYVYFPMKAMLYRFNPETGNLTTACADPLCDHLSNDCPFFSGIKSSAEYTYVDNDRIYYRVEQFYFTRDNYFDYAEIEHRVYHVADQKVTVSNRKYSDTVGFQNNDYCTGDKEYYFDLQYNEETGKTTVILRCYDIHTRKTRDIRDVSQENTLLIFYHQGDSLYYCDQVSIGILDTQTGKKHPIFEGDCTAASCDDQYIYYIRLSDQSIWRMDFNGKNNECLDQKKIVPISVYLTDTYLYYQYQNNNEIWRMKKDGSSPECIFRPEDGMYFFSYVVLGNYIYGLWVTSEIDESGQLVTSQLATEDSDGSILRIDITTGDQFYIEVPSTGNTSRLTYSH